MKEKEVMEPMHVLTMHILNFLDKKAAENSQSAIKKHKLLSRIDLKEGVAGDLFTVFLGVRFLRLEAYNLTLTLSEPFEAYGSTRANQVVLTHLNGDIENAEGNMREYLELVQRYLGDVTVLGIANRLELAANDLISSSTVDDRTKRKAELKFSKETLSEWSMRWKGKFDDVSLLDKIPR